MLVGRERMESAEIRESAGPRSNAVRRGATRPCVSSGKRAFGEPRSRRGDGGGRTAADDVASRSCIRVDGHSSSSSQLRTSGAGRPAGRLQQLCVPRALSLARLDTYAPRASPTMPIHRRPDDATAAATLSQTG